MIEGPDLRPRWAKLQEYFYISLLKGLTFARDGQNFRNTLYVVIEGPDLRPGWAQLQDYFICVGEGFEEITFKEERFENIVCTLFPIEA